MKSFCLIVCFAFLFSTTLLAQNHKTAKTKWAEAKQFYDSAKYSDCSKALLLAWNAETSQAAGKRDTQFLFKCVEYLGWSFGHSDVYDTAMQWLFLGKEIAARRKDTIETGRLTAIMNWVYEWSVYPYSGYNYAEKFPLEQKKKKYQMWKIDQVDGGTKNRVAGDTMYFRIRGGRNDGIFVNARCGFHTIHKPKGTKRPFHYYGQGHVTSVYANYSNCYIILDEDFADTVYVADGMYTESYVPVRAETSPLYQASLLGYTLKSYHHEMRYVKQTSTLYNLSPAEEQGIYQLMVDELHQARAALKKINYKYSDSVVTGGRFQGKTIAEAMESAEIIDVKHMLNDIRYYSNSYDNKTDNLYTMFISWAYDYNGDPTGNEQVIWKYIYSLKPGNEAAFFSKYKTYLNTSSTFDSTIASWIDTINDPTFKQQIRISKLMLDASKMGLPNSNQAFWLRQLTYTYHKAHDFENVYQYSKEWLKTGYSRTDALTELSMSANMTQRYNEAIAYADSILDNESGLYLLYDSFYVKDYLIYGLVEKGFAMLLNGKIKNSLPFLERAYQLDSNQRFTRFTYANSLALNGRTAESRFQYEECLKYSRNPNEIYYMQNDWKIFIDNGNLEAYFKTERERITKIFLEKYYYKLYRDSLVNIAYSFRKKQGDLGSAFHNYQLALDVCNRHTPHDSSSKLLILEWLGYIQGELKQDSLAMIYNMEACDVAEKYHFSNERILQDYDEVIYNSENAAQWAVYRRYTMKRDDLNNRLTLAKQKRLILFSCGTNTSTQTKIAENFAEKDAREFSNVVAAPAHLLFDSVITYSIIGKGLTLDSVNHTFDRIIYEAGENDVFFFYYAGPTLAENKYAQLNLYNDYFMVSEIAGKISQIQARKQVLLLDGGNIAVDSLNNYLRDYSNNYAKNSSCFITNKSWRQETEKGHGILSEAIFHFFESGNADGNISAQKMIEVAAASISNQTSALGIQAISRGSEIQIGRVKRRFSGKDLIKPVISLPSAFRTRGENIRVGSTGNNAINGFVSDNVGVMKFLVNGAVFPVGENGRFSIALNKIKTDTLTLVALDSSGNDTMVMAVVNRNNPTVNRSGRKIAWFFATQNFDSPEWQDLHNPVPDAQAMGDILKQYLGYEVHYVFDQDYSGMLDSLDEMKKIHYLAGDQLFVYFAGHGYKHENRGFMIVPSNAESPSGNRFLNYLPGSTFIQTYISGDDATKCNNIFLVMDLCFAGSLGEKSNKIPYKQPVSKPEEMTVNAFLNRQLGINCVEFLMSGRSNEVKEGVEGSHSPFAAKLMENMMKEISSGNSPYFSLQEMTPGLPQFGNKPEFRPVYGFFQRDDDGEYLFEIRNRKKHDGFPNTGVQAARP